MATPLHLRRVAALPALLGLSLLHSTAAAQETAPGDAERSPPPAAAPQPAGETAAPQPAGNPATPQPAGASQSAGAPQPAGDPATPQQPADDLVAAPPPAGDPAAADPLFARRISVRRSGLAVGIAGGFSLGSAAGYPNDVQKIGYQRHYTETGVGVGGGGYLWIGGALTDWFTFGGAVGGHGLIAANHSTLAGGFMFHTEIFPLFSLGGLWREVGVIFDAGTGVAYTAADAGGDTDVIDGALPARIGGGVFYEGIRLWKVSMGPWLYADYTWSASVRQPAFYLGWRSAIYTGP